MVYSEYCKQRILFWYSKGFKAPTIMQKMHQEGMSCSRQGIYKLIKRYQLSGSIARKQGSGRPSKVVQEIKDIVESRMQEDDETTAVQLHKVLEEKGYNISLSTILRCRKSLGWNYRGSAYCQMIRDVNKEKRLAWAREHLHDNFSNVIWSDETTVQMESHRRFCCRKNSQKPRYKPRYVGKDFLSCKT